jgi:protocatechuate 3,4-dioxygenase, beta subunit
MTPFLSRRHFGHYLGLSAAGLWVPGVFAEALTLTPKQTEGPFYPDKFPLDTDNDLIIINNSLTPSIGEVTYLSGKVTDIKGNPIRHATIEIWQCDGNGVYIHTRDSNPKEEKRDKNFQGYGKCLTGLDGNYYFRTIKPVPYTGRTPHIHFKIKHRDKELLTTQCYIKGHEQNEHDHIWKQATSQGDLVSIEFKPLANTKIGELEARFDIVLGLTPPE